MELNAKLKEAEVKRISAEEKLKLLDAQLQRAQHQVGPRVSHVTRLARARCSHGVVSHSRRRCLLLCSSASAAHMLLHLPVCRR